MRSLWAQINVVLAMPCTLDKLAERWHWDLVNTLRNMTIIHAPTNVRWILVTVRIIYQWSLYTTTKGIDSYRSLKNSRFLLRLTAKTLFFLTASSSIFLILLSHLSTPFGVLNFFLRRPSRWLRTNLDLFALSLSVLSSYYCLSIWLSIRNR